MAPEPPVKIEIAPEPPKSFLERFDDFPDLKKKEQRTTNVSVLSESMSAVHNSPVKVSCIGGDFNFLEDDGWLDGDDIDYTQNLFQDNDHFIFPKTVPINSTATISAVPTVTTFSDSKSTASVCAKTLLAERCHSSKKQDIWKRSEVVGESTQKVMKIKILKRPDSEIVKSKEELTVKEISEETPKNTSTVPITIPSSINTSDTTSIKTTAKKFTTTASSTRKTDNHKEKDKEEIAKREAKIVYSSASKKLQKKEL